MLKTEKLGRDIFYYHRASSTNLVLKHMARAGVVDEGAVVLAETQTMGRGRLDREWFSPPGGLWFSVLLRTRRPDSLIPHAAGVAVVLSIRKMGLESVIKWPNDVLVGGKKLAGILTEVGDWGVVVGIGINANVDTAAFPPDVRERSTTLLEITCVPVDREKLLADVLLELEKEYNLLVGGGEEGKERLLEKWIALTDTIGRYVVVLTPMGEVRGRAVAIDPSGALVVETPDGGIKKVAVGDCLYLR